ncbi:MAG: hypothetical protein WD512_19345, partial [Candidatus Paceibacterota bacterium]
MGFDYYCPECKGPAYRTSNYDYNNPPPCEACSKGWPTSYVCSWCNYECSSTVRYGGEICKSKKYFGKDNILIGTCAYMICDKCIRDNKEICKSCYKSNRTLLETLTDLQKKLEKLTHKISNVKHKIEKSILKENRTNNNNTGNAKANVSTDVDTDVDAYAKANTDAKANVDANAKDNTDFKVDANEANEANKGFMCDDGYAYGNGNDCSNRCSSSSSS